MATNWRPIKEAERGLGDLLLRNGSDSYQSAYVGRQSDDGRWRIGDRQEEAQPTHFCLIPLFDADDGASA